MPYQKIKFKPGVYKDDTPLEAKGYWVDTDKIRFVRGLPETIYGWEQATTTALLGICRGAMTWADNGRNPFAAFGTSQRLYAMDVNGLVYDITPVTSRTQGVSITVTTTLNSAIASIGWTAHALVALQEFTIDSSTTATVGGITVNGTYAVVTVTDANDFTFTAAQTATSNAGPTSATVNFSVNLTPGQVDGLGGLGYGVGGYGSGGYGGAASGYTLYPTSWSLAQWGQNLIANPRGGALYEWAPYTAPVELTVNGTFTGGATGWSLGSGWSYGTNNIAASNASTSAQQNVTTTAGAWHIVSVGMGSWTTGTLLVSYGATTIIPAKSANGTYRATFNAGSGGTATLALTGTNLSANIGPVSMQILATANIITNAPTQNTCCFVTNERILVSCGSINPAGAFDPMLINWTDTENNQTWTALATNLAGSYTLSNGSRIVRGLTGPQYNLIWTDTALFIMAYNGQPNSVYTFQEIASACGLIGPNAATIVGGVAYWADPAGGFWMYDGTYPQPLRCTMARDVRDNLAFSQQDKIYAFPVTTAGRLEVWWLYPDIRDGNECSRYVAYGITETQDAGMPVWANGKFDRTSWVNNGTFQFPLAVDAEGQVWFQEKGFTQGGGARSWSATTAYFDLADDGLQMRVKNIQPDTQGQQGNFSVNINTNIRNGNGILNRAFGPYNVMPTSGKVNVRASGEEAQLVFSGNSSPAAWRLGAFRYEIEGMGRTR